LGEQRPHWIILGAVVVLLVVVWLAAIWLMLMDPRALLPKWQWAPKAVSFVCINAYFARFILLFVTKDQIVLVSPQKTVADVIRKR
jgi:hypothetical protein